MKFSELKKHLTGAPAGVYAIEGNDRYLVSHAKKLFSDCVDLPELNVNSFEASASGSEVASACNVMPMLSPKRLVFYHGIKAIDDALKSYVASPSPDAMLVLLPSVPIEKLGLGGAVTAIDCDHLSEELLAGWIRKESEGRLDAGATTLLIRYTLGDLARISTEVPKLCAYVTEGPVTETHVERMVACDEEYKLYELTEKIAGGRTDEAYRMLASLRRECDPLMIIKTVNTHFRNLLQVAISRSSENEIAASMRKKPFALKYLRAQAKQYTPVRLKAIIDYIADCDFRIKSGLLPSDAALDNIVLKIFALNKTLASSV